MLLKNIIGAKIVHCGTPLNKVCHSENEFNDPLLPPRNEVSHPLHNRWRHTHAQKIGKSDFVVDYIKSF